MEIQEIDESDLEIDSFKNRVRITLPVMDNDTGELIDEAVIKFAEDIQYLEPDIIVCIRPVLSFTRILNEKSLKPFLSGIHFDSLPYTEVLFSVSNDKEKDLQSMLDKNGLLKYLGDENSKYYNR